MNLPLLGVILIYVIFFLCVFVIYYNVRLLVLFHKKTISDDFHLPSSFLDRPVFRVLFPLLLFSMGITILYGYYVEPFALKIRTVAVDSPKCHFSRPYTVCLLSDIHLERRKNVLKKVANVVQEERPDVIVFAGDYFNEVTQDTEKKLISFFKTLEAPDGKWGVLGNWDSLSMIPTLEKGDVTILQNEKATFSHEENFVTLHGLDYNSSRGMRKFGSELGRNHFNILLNHTPDMIPEAADEKFDLYLCGHTHGGQICIPLYGAVITFSKYGKRFESGRYRIGDMTAYVSRGVGLEGGLAPRVRFCAPPEVVFIEVR